MKRIAILIATTGGPVLVDRITPEPAPQSMVCLRRQSDVLPISADYDDFVRPGSGVIMREFGPYEEGAFRLDVSGPIGTGLSWQLGVFAAHAIFKSETCELSELEDADQIIWLSGTVDYDLNVGDVDHMAEKVESSAFILADYIAKETPIIFATGMQNAEFLKENEPPEGITVAPMQTTKDLMKVLGLYQEPEPAPNKSFWPMAAMAILAVGAVFAFTFGNGEDETSTPKPLKINLTSDRGENPIFHFGDDLNLLVEVTQEAWLNCFYRQADGTSFQFYPNAQVKNVTSFAPNKKHVLSGAKDSTFVLRLGPPAGREEVTCYASPEKIDIDPKRIPTGVAKDRLSFDLKP